MNREKAKLNRRQFLKIMGLGTAGSGLAACDLPTTVTLEEGKEDVAAYLAPEEYAIPGIGVWYASTCQQCPAGCAIHGRVREGRALKIEGNPDSAMNHGKTCMMGQAAVQTHYNPNRLRKPMLKKKGKLVTVEWKDAEDVLRKQLGSDAQLGNNAVAWLTGHASGHQAILIKNHLEALGSDDSRHFRHEVVASPVWQAVAKDMFGDANPLLDIANAKCVVSFGADFLGTWQSPVHFAGEYAKFRRGERGIMIVAEPKMTITGANADLWLAVKPGSEGALALGVANILLSSGVSADLPDAIRAKVTAFTPAKASQVSGVAEKRIKQIADTLKKNSPSLILAGASAESQTHGYQNVAAVMVLNVILGNIGKTVQRRDAFPMPGMQAETAGTKALSDFVTAANNGELKVALFQGANPVYTAPSALKISDALAKVGFKVQFAVNKDETSAAMDLVIPTLSGLEDWGTHVPFVQPADSAISVQQPLMEPLYPDSRGFGDILITMLTMRGAPEFDKFKDYYGYLRNWSQNLPSAIKGGVDNDAFWVNSLQKAQIAVTRNNAAVRVNFEKVNLEGIDTQSAAKGLTMIPSARLGLWDGRHANLPWLQEAPDQINKVVWDSWAEIHPKTAKDLGIAHGDMLEVKSSHGSIKVKAFLFKGIHPSAIAVPLGQGHDENFGQFAKGIGANPLQILDPAQVNKETGEWAMFGQTVNVRSVGRGDLLVRMGAVDTQYGRNIAVVIPADQYRRTEGGKA